MVTYQWYQSLSASQLITTTNNSGRAADSTWRRSIHRRMGPRPAALPADEAACLQVRAPLSVLDVCGGGGPGSLSSAESAWSVVDHFFRDWRLMKKKKKNKKNGGAPSSPARRRSRVSAGAREAARDRQREREAETETETCTETETATYTETETETETETVTETDR